MSVDVGQLYETTHPALCSYFGARLATGQRHMSEDLASSTLERVVRFAARYEDRGVPMRAWVFKIARNILIDYIRTLPSQQVCSLENSEMFLFANRSEPVDLRRLRDYDTVDLRVTLLASMQNLTAAQRDVITLRFFENRTERETAAALGRTLDGVKKLQSRALAQMKTALTKEAA